MFEHRATAKTTKDHEKNNVAFVADDLFVVEARRSSSRFAVVEEDKLAQGNNRHLASAVSCVSGILRWQFVVVVVPTEFVNGIRNFAVQSVRLLYNC